MKKKYEILNRIKELNEGWQPDWNNSNHGNCCLVYRHDKKEYFIAEIRFSQTMPDEYYFKSHKIGEQLIQEFGNDLKYLFVL